MSEDSRIAIVVFQRLVKSHGYLGTPFICLSHQDPPADLFRENRCGSLCAAEYEVEMGRSPLGEWRIAKETMLWIS